MSPRQPGSAPVDDPLCGLDEDQKFWDRRGWLVAGVWVIFLVFPVLDLLVEDYSLPTRIIGLALIALFAAVYLQSYSKFSSKIGQGGTSARRAHVNFLMLCAIIVLGIPVVGLTTMGLFPFITSFAIFLLGRRWAIAAYSAVLVLSFALPIIYGQFMDAIFLIGLNLVLMVVYAITVAAIRRSTEAEKMRSDYLLVAEQERVARDVHDGIGHSLTALNLKAQLALRLLDQEQYAQARGEL